MKRGKELKIENVENFNVIFGTVDSKKPKSVYINITGWGNPIHDEEIDYGKIIKETHKQLKKSIFGNCDENYFNKDKTIIDFDMRESGIQYGKRSYMSCEITLYQTNELSLSSEELYDALMTVLNGALVNNLNDHEYFKYYKGKA